MKRRNLGQTSLKRRSRTGDPMQTYDRLPPELRSWLSEAALPWSPASARRAYAAAMVRTGGDTTRALARLDQIQRRLMARDAPRIWEGHHHAHRLPLADLSVGRRQPGCLGDAHQDAAEGARLQRPALELPEPRHPAPREGHLNAHKRPT